MAMYDAGEFTKGKWVAKASDSDTCHYEVVVATMNGDTVAGEYGIENPADALLIAEAPLMFDALRAIAELAVSVDEMRSLARKAICIFEEFDASGFGVQP